MSTSTTRKRRSAVLALALLAMAAAAVAAVAQASTDRSDRQLARALAVAKDDVPSSWTMRWFPDARGKCTVRSQSGITARVRDGFDDGAQFGMWSVATVLKTRAAASRYYERVTAAMPACLRVAVRHAPIDADSVGIAQRLSFGRYGERSTASQLPATYRGNPYYYDSVVVRTGRAVLVDTFVLGAEDRGAVAMEQEILRRALRRASAGA